MFFRLHISQTLLLLAVLSHDSNLADLTKKLGKLIFRCDTNIFCRI